MATPTTLSVRRRIAGVALLPLVAGLVLATQQEAAAALPAPVWAEHSLVRVMKTAAPKTASAITLYAARNETESYQVVVNGGASGLTGVNLALSDLVGPGGAVISRTRMRPYREHYVNVTRSSPNLGGTNRPGPRGLYPDALIPFTNPLTGVPLNGTLKAANASVAARTNQPYWVDIKVPTTATPGSYTGTATIKAAQGSARVRVTLRVMSFTLPTKPALRSSFLDWSQNPAIGRQLLDNKLMPAWAGNNVGTWSSRYGLNATNLYFYSGADISTCRMSSPPALTTLQARATSLRKPGVHLYNYTADEIDSCPGLTRTVQAWARALHKVGARQLVTMAPTPALYTDGAGGHGVDNWVVLPWMYDKSPARVREALSKGMAVWSYNTLVQDGYSPKWLIDFRPMDFRIQPGMINASLRLTGLLYWKVNGWTSSPWSNIQTFQGGYPGDGMLVYPGAQVGMPGGAAPSMRLKWLRDGVEDYDYVHLAKRAGRGTQALAITTSVGKDWRTWTRDVRALSAARLKLALLLDARATTR